MADNMKFLLVVLFVPIVSIIICSPFDSIRKTYSEQINETETHSSKLGVDATIYNNPLMGIRFNKFTNWDFLSFTDLSHTAGELLHPAKSLFIPTIFLIPKSQDFKFMLKSNVIVVRY